jgi:cytochrome b6-f complex iron-sulfur subunit
MAQAGTSRREVLRLGAAAAAVAAVCGGCSIFGSRKADVTAEAKQGVIHLTRAQSATLMASEGSMLVKAEGIGDKILVVHLKDHVLYATSAVCTHMGCTVDYNKNTGRIDCPCHGSQFSLDGAVVHGPAKQPLKRYEATAENGQVVIKV